MSETVYYRGKLERVSKEEETAEQASERICKELGVIEIKSYNDTWEEELTDQGYYDYYIHNNVVYKTNKENVDLDEDIMKIDKELNYELKFYNGGCSFTEAMDEAFALKRKKN